ncbi:MAG: helix-turn-helix domain-containing protein [Chloroflexi bacterium]|nr:helix-turn-helix domain-containing protein [Chloroflexota bacterium]
MRLLDLGLVPGSKIGIDLTEHPTADSLRTVARLKLEGYTVEEIAQQMDCSSRTVKRKLALIRTRWSEENESSD